MCDPRSSRTSSRGIWSGRSRPAGSPDGTRPLPRRFSRPCWSCKTSACWPARAASARERAGPWRLFAPSVFQELDQPRGREAIAAYMDARRCVDPTLCALAAERRGAADVIELSEAIGSISDAREATSGFHCRIRAYQAGNDGLRAAIARAARNRYLAAVSVRLTGTCATRNGRASRDSVARRRRRSSTP